jgi:hypothetical protein
VTNKFLKFLKNLISFRLKDSHLIGGAIERRFSTTVFSDPEKSAIEICLISDKMVGIDLCKKWQHPAAARNSFVQKNLNPQTPIGKGRLAQPSQPR